MVRPIPASPLIPSDGGLPHLCARSAPTLVVSRPAQRSLRITACRLAASPRRHIFLEGFDGFVTSTIAPIAPGWSDPVARRDLHPLKTNTFTRRTHRATPGVASRIFGVSDHKRLAACHPDQKRAERPCGDHPAELFGRCHRDQRSRGSTEKRSVTNAFSLSRKTSRRRQIPRRPVERKGIEPSTSALRTRRSPN